MADNVKQVMRAQELLDKRYGLGDMNNGRMDCLSFLWQFYGDSIPHDWNGWNAKNYAVRWSNGEGRHELYEFLHSLGVEIEQAYMTDNDLLIIDTPDGVTPAIYLGSGNIMIVTIEQGVFVMPINYLSCDIMEVRRIG